MKKAEKGSAGVVLSSVGDVDEDLMIHLANSFKAR